MVASMDRWLGKIAIVTGASSGIGAATADLLVEHGLIVVGAARRSELVEERAKKLSEKKGKLYSFKADLSKEEDILRLFEWTSKNLGPVHILINNAGKGAGTNLIEGNTKKWKSVFDLNVLGLCIATREAVKIMRSNDTSGHIVHINSVLGHKIMYSPILSVYPASKFAVTALAESLRLELNSLGLKIKVTSISPGLVETELTTLSPNSPPEWKATIQNMPILKAEDVADAVVYVLSTPEHVQVHELMLRPVGQEV